MVRKKEGVREKEGERKRDIERERERERERGTERESRKGIVFQETTECILPSPLYKG